jgi:hypothetical protein
MLSLANWLESWGFGWLEPVLIIIFHKKLISCQWLLLFLTTDISCFYSLHMHLVYSTRSSRSRNMATSLRATCSVQRIKVIQFRNEQTTKHQTNNKPATDSPSINKNYPVNHCSTSFLLQHFHLRLSNSASMSIRLTFSSTASKSFIFPPSTSTTNLPVLTTFFSILKLIH